MRALAARAQGDRSALVQLRAVDRVDGAPVDLARALDASGTELRSRLRALAGASSLAPAPQARRQAESILRQRRFQGSSVPRPFHGVLHWLGHELAFVGDAVNWLAAHIPGGRAVVWTILAAIVVALAALAGWRIGRRRGGRLVELAAGGRGERAVDPARLERQADEAERRGELEHALRLRFRAGLLRLARAGAIPSRDSVTSAEVSRTLRSPGFELLARDFDEVVYGDRSADGADLDRARAEWPAVVAQATR